ncbi:MAG: urea carboxylase-associated family protein [Actinobacteria bacterium]|nr:urea carboxylase-associated family protein [Actinomycetota bacterium]
MSKTELGPLATEVVVPACEARTIKVRSGQVLQIVDVEGRQVGDLVAYRPDRPDEHFSAGHTVSCLTKLVPEVGDEVFSNHRTPLLRIRRDDVGNHDLIVPCCDPERYSRDYDRPDHGSCLASIERSLRDFGSKVPVAGESAWNVFMNNRLEGGRIVTYEPEHGAGSLIELDVLEDLVVTLSACPQDLSPCNAYEPTAMAMRVYDGRA